MKRDYEKAADLYRKAAEQNYAPGQAYLATLYSKGKGVPQDYGKAAGLFRSAVDQNDPNSFNSLAWFLATCPEASQRNGKEAIVYATKAWKPPNGRTLTLSAL